MQNSDTLHNAIFVDRDGVVIHNQDEYVRSLQQVKIYPRALQALARAAQAGFKIVMVTNQAGVGKGLYSMETVQEINEHIRCMVEAACGRIDGIYVCPHRSDEDCACRKPKPGLLLQAAEALHIDLSRSFMVGDALSDLQAGQAAGVRQSILVLTGRGRGQRKLAGDAARTLTIRRSLFEAVQTIIDMTHLGNQDPI